MTAIIQIIFIPFFLFTTVIIPERNLATASIAIDPKREQLLKDALSWMTFRKNGILMADTEYESLFLDTLLQKYTTSKFYRTFVIAFNEGVIPRLTLNEGVPCDPLYTKQYKDPFNSSVTWHFQKKFTFQSYDTRNSGGLQYCDYRQGLICHASKKICQCPPGSSMQQISPSSQLRRCLLAKDEICALIDIAHGIDPKHSPLAGNMYHLLFNLEKPPSCMEDTQCRFKQGGTRSYPQCHDIKDGPWDPPPPSTVTISWDLSLGSECAIGLLANPGSCMTKPTFEGGNNGGYICYNFGPPQSQRGSIPLEENKIGFCFGDYGSYSFASTSNQKDKLYLRPFFIAFVHPRTVPLRGDELRGIYKKYMGEIEQNFANFGNRQPEVDEVGDRCTVSNTEIMDKAWKYFASLEDDPLPGEDYVAGATKMELEANLQSVSDIVKAAPAKICKVYWSYYPFDKREIKPSLKCVQANPPDANGNDGKCEESGTESQQFALNLEKYLVDIWDARYDLAAEKTVFRKDILLEHPEPPCLPSLGSLPPQLFRHHNPDTLEGGACPAGSVCYQDFSDSHDFYDSSCDLKPTAQQVLNCHDTSQALGKCEDQHLGKLVNKALMEVDQYGRLGEGESCFYNFEKALREMDKDVIDKMNKYELLRWLELEILCDKGQKLECTPAGTCQCIGGTCAPPPPPPPPPPVIVPEPPEPGETIEITEEKDMKGDATMVMTNKFWMIISFALVVSNN